MAIFWYLTKPLLTVPDGVNAVSGPAPMLPSRTMFDAACAGNAQNAAMNRAVTDNP
jgi:hypothetical protein